MSSRSLQSHPLPTSSRWFVAFILLSGCTRFGFSPPQDAMVVDRSIDTVGDRSIDTVGDGATESTADARDGLGDHPSPADANPDVDFSPGDIGDPDVMDAEPVVLGDLGPDGPLLLRPEIVSGVTIAATHAAGPITFTAQNLNQSATARLGPPVLVGTNALSLVVSNNQCAKKVLEPGASCTFELLPRIAADGPIDVQCHVTDGTRKSNTAHISGAASGAKSLPADRLCNPSGWCWRYPRPHGNDYWAIAATSTAMVAVGSGGVVTRQIQSASATHEQIFTDSSLSGVWADEGGVIVAVGPAGRAAHFNGLSWSTRQTPTSANLLGVWGSGPNNVFAYGTSGALLHFDGSAWTTIDKGITSTLTGHWASSDTNVLLVGSGGTILRYNGKDWLDESIADGPNFSAVWQSAAGDRAYAVGGTQTWEKKGTGSWTRVNQANLFGLYDVWGVGATDVFTVGHSGITYRFDGLVWTVQTTPTAEGLAGLAGLGPTDVYAAGDGGTLSHYDGTSWKTSFSFSFPNAHFTQITPCQTQICAAGVAGMLVRGTHTGGWTTESSGRQFRSLRGLWASGTDIFAISNDVAYRGMLLHFSNAGDSVMHQGMSQSAQSIWGSSPSDIFVGQNRGVIAHYDGKTWTEQTLPVTRSVRRIWGFGPNSVYALVGSSLYHWAGASWAAVVPVVPFTVPEDIIGFGPDDIYLVGGGGMIRHWDGSFWFPMNGKTVSTIGSIWGSGPNDIYATVRSDKPIHFDGTSWEPLDTGLGVEDWTLVRGRSSTEVYLSRYDLTGRFDGARWTPMVFPGPNSIYYLSVSGDRVTAGSMFAIYELY